MDFPLRNIFKRKSPPGTIIFLHIPKTAGTSLQQLINRQFDPALVYEMDNSDARKSMEVFKNIPDEEKVHYKVVLGHMWFGLHRHIPQPSSYITILRDPVERVISHYYFVKRRPDHYLYETVMSGNLTLGQYVENKLSTELNNGQTRLLSGEMDEETYSFGKCTPQMLETAKKNLKNHFSVVGIQEAFDDTLQLVRKRLKWKVSDIMENVTPNRPDREKISQDTIDTIKKYNQLDIDLYGFARELFTDMKKHYLEG